MFNGKHSPAMNPAGYYRHATIASNTIAFVCEDDLWSWTEGDRAAHRITVGSGEISTPRLSPDGERIAFVNSEEGHPEISVMDAVGSPPTRLTFLGVDGDRRFALYRAHFDLLEAGLVGYIRETLAVVEPSYGASAYAWLTCLTQHGLLPQGHREYDAARYDGDAFAVGAWSKFFKEISRVDEAPGELGRARRGDDLWDDDVVVGDVENFDCSGDGINDAFTVG